MKKAWSTIIAALFACMGAAAQDIELSTEGMAHWLEANAIIQTAQHEVDFLKAAQEMEKVVETDPDVADVYYNLGIMYGKYAEMVGSNQGAFNRAINYFRKYLTYNPDERERVYVEAEIKRLERLLDRANIVRYEDGVGNIYEGPLVNGKPVEGKTYIVTVSDKHTVYSGRYEGTVVHQIIGIYRKDEGTFINDYWGITMTGKFGAGGRDGDEKLIGPGKIVTSNGDVLEATFDRSGAEGKGVFTWADGMKYEGEFHKNLFEGQGRLTDWEGKVIYEGNFEKGKPTGEYNGPHYSYFRYFSHKLKW